MDSESEIAIAQSSADDEQTKAVQEPNGASKENLVSLESRIEVYHAISEWIRFADAKAAVLLTVGGALAGFLIPSVRNVLIHSKDDHWLP